MSDQIVAETHERTAGPVRDALIIANSHFSDPALRQLRSPTAGARELAQVLREPDIGGFDVQLLADADQRSLRQRVMEFFRDRQPDDLLLVHLSGHGITAPNGELYLAAADTAVGNLGATAFPASFLSECIASGASRHVVLILDCCYSGAFNRAPERLVAEDVDVERHFAQEGRSHAVLTASSATEYAIEGNAVSSGLVTPSVFTSALVEGLRTGAADLNADGSISVDELYRYVAAHMRGSGSLQRPQRWLSGRMEELIVARNLHRPSSTREIARQRLNPSALQSAAELGLALNALRGNTSVATVAAIMNRIGPAVPPITVSAMLSGIRLPSTELLVGYLSVVGVTAFALWIDALNRIRKRTRAEVRRVSTVSPLELGVHPAGADEKALTPYVRRDADQDLRDAIERAQATGGFIIVAGPALCGKTRTAYENLYAVVPHAPITSPSNPQQLTELAGTLVPGSVLWLDDLWRYVAGTPDVVTAIQEGIQARRLIVMATSSNEQLRLLASILVSVPGSEALHNAQIIDLPETLTPNELAAARRLAGTDSRIAQALAQDHSPVFAWAAGSDELISRWNLAKDPYERAVVIAAADIRRIGYQSPLNAAMLCEAAQAYIPAGQGNVSERWELVLDRLTGPGEPAILAQTQGGLVLSSFLYDHIRRTRRVEPIPEAVWRTLSQYNSPALDVMAVATSAERRLLFRHAERLYDRVADEYPAAAERLAVILVQQGRRNEWLSRADDNSAARTLERLLGQANWPPGLAGLGESDQTTRVVRRLLLALVEQHRLDEALVVWLAFRQEGDLPAPFNISDLAKLVQGNASSDLDLGIRHVLWDYLSVGYPREALLLLLKVRQQPGEPPIEILEVALAKRSFLLSPSRPHLTRLQEWMSESHSPAWVFTSSGPDAHERLADLADRGEPYAARHLMMNLLHRLDLTGLHNEIRAGTPAAATIYLRILDMAGMPGASQLARFGVSESRSLPSIDGEAIESTMASATTDPPSDVPPVTAGDADDQHINFWIRERERDPHIPLAAQITYTGVFNVGAIRTANLATGMGPIPRTDIPEAGLETEWIAWSTAVKLEAADDGATCDSVVAGDSTQYMARFGLRIPRTGESAEQPLLVTPLTDGQARIDVIVLVGGDPYREFTIYLHCISPRSADQAAPAPGPAPISLTLARPQLPDLPPQLDGSTAIPAVLTEEQILVPQRHLLIQSDTEWKTPAKVLQLIILGNTYQLQCNEVGISDTGQWIPNRENVEHAISQTRKALEAVREEFHDSFDDIPSDELGLYLTTLKTSSPWCGPSDLTKTKWADLLGSEALQRMAFEGYGLCDLLFPPQSPLRRALLALDPSDKIEITWQDCDGTSWVRHVPWSLMYLGDAPSASQPVDPSRFAGLRYRISYRAYKMSARSRNIDDAATRAHLYYWGAAESDETWSESQRHAADLALWSPLTLPSRADAKAQCVEFLEDPCPRPVGLIYLYCKCLTGNGTEPVLRFGSDNSESNTLSIMDLGLRDLPDQPLVFANACDTVISDPFTPNLLEQHFFRRGCRAFIGTECKVPIRLASAFARIFFHFLYTRDDGMTSAGEAMSQTRRLLWERYSNIGGLFYSYLNDYHIYLGTDEEVAEMSRVQSMWAAI